MKKGIVPIGISSSLVLLYCLIFMNFQVKVVVTNASETVYDSVSVYVFPDKRITFYNVKPHDRLSKTFDYKNFSYPRGEHTASVISAYKDDYYLVQESGLIDTPFAFLKEEYNYFIYDGYITTKKDFKPVKLPEKYKISEMPKESIKKVNKDK